ncbi:CYTH domain-containing protein [Butyrivibrio sp. X503]|uniref:CYTH domain-containing protein n=1 Tax=Butyrivibrio sp. X503 TaxID=2364878 RepID=UPI00268D4245
MGIEIEKKFTVKELPKELNKYPYHIIEQGYLCVNPAVRVRREDDKYYMTYKCSLPEDEGGIGKTEYNMPLTEESYAHLVEKCDGNIIRKIRHLIPLNEDAFDKEYLSANPQIRSAAQSGDIKIELDVFKAPFDGRLLAEVEFPTEEAASAYHPASWFLDDVTGDYRYSNSSMSEEKI